MRVDNVEVVRKFLSALRARDMSACASLTTDDFVVSEPASLPYGGEWTGIQGLTDMLSAVGRSYRIDLDAPELHGFDESVLVRVSGTITARESGRQMRLDALDLYQLRNGAILSLNVYYKDAVAVVDLLAAEE